MGGSERRISPEALLHGLVKCNENGILSQIHQYGLVKSKGSGFSLTAPLYNHGSVTLDLELQGMREEREKRERRGTQEADGGTLQKAKDIPEI
ncbi:hypothetical protein PoB_007508900 [Plakobranchus ocellatus]|uniref:Uncharacterized protein n=1 Tax=Plakobranchus ocellatus TaxID=259542 RepID=A0AAV4DWZ0_9GAST|nr:hypothetical protein PoB_007508900 [Plakobranchus ocellatus]